MAYWKKQKRTKKKHWQKISRSVQEHWKISMSWAKEIEGALNECPKHISFPFLYPIQSFFFQFFRSWMKHNVSKNIWQQDKVLVNLWTEIRLNEKEGMQRTLVKVKVDVIWIVPIWVTTAVWPFGSLTLRWETELTVVKRDTELTIWSIALVSKIQSLADMSECWENVVEKTECSKFFGIPDMCRKGLQPSVETWLTSWQLWKNSQVESYQFWLEHSEWPSILGMNSEITLVLKTALEMQIVKQPHLIESA